MVYALISNGVVVNTILADANFIAHIQNNYSSIIRIDQLSPVPGVGWTYDGSNFSPPEDE